MSSSVALSDSSISLNPELVATLTDYWAPQIFAPHSTPFSHSSAGATDTSGKFCLFHGARDPNSVNTLPTEPPPQPLIIKPTMQ